MNYFSRKLVITLISLSFGLVGCKNSSDQPSQTRSPRLQVVHVEETNRETMISYIDITGSIAANIISDVTSPVNGVIEHLYARENQRVTKDMIIAVINPDDRVALIASNLRNIQEIERQLENSEQGSDAYLHLKEKFDEATKNMEYAKRMYTTVPVICPMNGLVTERWADEGSQVGFRDKIITVSDMSSLVIKAEVNEKYFESIRAGRIIPVSLAAYPNDSVSGRISLVYPQIDQTTRSVKFDIKVQQFSKPLLPGMMAQLRIPVLTNENAITITEDAVMISPDNEKYVFVVDNDSIVHRQIVETGIASYRKLEIISGLKENEYVVVKGQQMLRDKMKVQILPNAKQADQ